MKHAALDFTTSFLEQGANQSEWFLKNNFMYSYCFDKRIWNFRLLISSVSSLLGFKFGEAE